MVRVQSQVASYQRLKKWYLIPPLLNTQQYTVRIKGKVEQSRERSNSYSKGSLLAAKFYLLTYVSVRNYDNLCRISSKLWQRQNYCIDAPHGRERNVRRKTPEFYVLFGSNPRSNIPQNSVPSQKPSECWNKNEHISDVLQWTLTHGRVSVGRLAKTYIHQFCADTRYCLEDVPGVINDWNVRRESGNSVMSIWFNDDTPEFRL